MSLVPDWPQDFLLGVKSNISMTLFTDTPKFEAWLDELASMPSTPVSENLYGSDVHGQIRLSNLREYFGRMALMSPKIILVGEAPGYQGTRRTGVPFGSEFAVTGGLTEVSFFNDTNTFRRVYDDRVYKEPTSTIMWRTISKYDTLPILWAAYPLHPHKPGNVESNRTPTRSEVASTRAHLLKLLELTNIETTLALGNIAKATLDELGIASQKIRHPAHGGGPTFTRQLHEFMTTPDI
jgi:uracil-DNA glycosylase